MIDPDLLSLLSCPITHTALSYDAHTNTLISKAAQLSFPIKDGIPILLVAEATNLSDVT
jgi:uncharacterized protein YbaR (Trm112 family)